MHGGLVQKIEFLPRFEDQGSVTLGPEFSDQRGPDETAVPGDEDPTVQLHGIPHLSRILGASEPLPLPSRVNRFSPLPGPEQGAFAEADDGHPVYDRLTSSMSTKLPKSGCIRVKARSTQVAMPKDQPGVRHQNLSPPEIQYRSGV